MSDQFEKPLTRSWQRMGIFFFVVLLILFTWPRDLNMCKPAPAASRTVYRLPMVIQQYRDRSEGRLPQSWQEIADSPGYELDILQGARKTLVLDARYRFLPQGEVIVSYGGNEEEILVMEANGEGDGAHISYTLGIPHIRDRARYCFVKTAHGTIEARRYSETFLSRQIDLARYTSSAPISPGFRQITFDWNDSNAVLLVPLCFLGWAASLIVRWRRAE